MEKQLNSDGKTAILPYVIAERKICTKEKLIKASSPLLFCPLFFYHFTFHLLPFYGFLLFAKEIRYLEFHPRPTESEPPSEAKTQVLLFILVLFLSSFY